MEFRTLNLIKLNDVNVAKRSTTEVSQGSKLIVRIVNAFDQRIFIRWTTTGLIDILTHNVVQVNQ